MSLVGHLHEPDIRHPFHKPTVRLLFITRMVRLFAYGFLALILWLYLAALGLTPERIGLLLTMTLLGDVAISLWITTTADRIGRKRMLIVGALLMALAGAVFLSTDDYYLLLAAATIGVISPSGNEVGPFLAIEQAALAQVVTAEQRTRVFAWYNLAGSLATAFGALLCGLLVQLLLAQGLPALTSYRIALWLYAGVGVLLAVLFLGMPRAAEAPGVGGLLERPSPPRSGERGEGASRRGDITPHPRPLSPEYRGEGRDLEHAQAPSEAAPPARTFLGLHRSRGVVLMLSAMFAIDAFAGGFVLQSIMAYWFQVRFGADPAMLGVIFWAANFLAGFSALAAAAVARRVGLLRTMVFTHAPSNLLLILVPFMPNLPLAVAVLLLRFAISQMDVPARQSYTAALVSADERSAAAGVTGVARTAGAALSPYVVGFLLAPELAKAGWPFLISGGLKLLYDGLVYWRFRAVVLPEERKLQKDEKGSEK